MAESMWARHEVHYRGVPNGVSECLEAAIMQHSTHASHLPSENVGRSPPLIHNKD